MAELTPEQRSSLRTKVEVMISNGKTDEEISKFVNEYKAQLPTLEVDPVKKKVETELSPDLSSLESESGESLLGSNGTKKETLPTSESLTDLPEESYVDYTEDQGTEYSDYESSLKENKDARSAVREKNSSIPLSAWSSADREVLSSATSKITESESYLSENKYQNNLYKTQEKYRAAGNMDRFKEIYDSEQEKRKLDESTLGEWISSLSHTAESSWNMFMEAVGNKTTSEYFDDQLKIDIESERDLNRTKLEILNTRDRKRLKEDFQIENEKMIESFHTLNQDIEAYLPKTEQWLSDVDNGLMSVDEYNDANTLLSNSLNYRSTKYKEEVSKLNKLQLAMESAYQLTFVDFQHPLQTTTNAAYNEFIKVPRQVASVAVALAPIVAMTTPFLTEKGTVAYATKKYIDIAKDYENATLHLDERNPMSAVMGAGFVQVGGMVTGAGVANKIAGKTGARIATHMMGFAMGHDEFFSDGLRYDIDPVVLNRQAMLYGVISGVLESLGSKMAVDKLVLREARENVLERIVKDGILSKKAMEEIVFKTIKSAGLTSVVSGVSEGLTEVFQGNSMEYIHQRANEYEMTGKWTALELGQYDKWESGTYDLMSKGEYTKSMTDNFKGGFGIGSLFGGGGAIKSAGGSTFSAAAGMLMDPNGYASLKNLAKLKFESGEYTKAEYNEVAKNITDSKQALVVSQGINNTTDLKESINLSLEKSKLQSGDKSIANEARVKEINSRLGEIGANNAKSLSYKSRQILDDLSARYTGVRKVVEMIQSSTDIKVEKDKEGKNVVDNTDFIKAKNRAVKEIDKEIAKLEGNVDTESIEILNEVRNIREDLANNNGKSLYTGATIASTKMDAVDLKRQFNINDATNYVAKKSDTDRLTEEDVKNIKQLLNKRGVDPNTILSINELKGMTAADARKLLVIAEGRLGSLSTESRSYLDVQNIANATGVEAKIVTKTQAEYKEMGYSDKVATAMTLIKSRMIASIAARTGKSKNVVAKNMKLKDDAIKLSEAVTSEGSLAPLLHLANVYSEHMTPSEKRKVIKWAGETEWNDIVAAKFARSFVKYVSLGQTNISSLEDSFSDLKEFIVDTLGELKGTDINLRVSAAIKNIHAKAMGDFNRARFERKRKYRDTVLANIRKQQDIKISLENKLRRVKNGEPEVVISEEESKRKLHDPRTESEVAKDRASEVKYREDMDSKMMQDDEGNYIFHHYSDEKRPTLVAQTASGSLAISKEEQRAIDSVGGVIMFYTQANQKELHTGDVLHEVKIPKDRVYVLHSDSEGFYWEAKKRFNERFPNQAFTPNHQAAWIALVAEENGYDMLVAEWGADKGWRGQRVNPLSTEEGVSGKRHTDFFTGKAAKASSKISWKPTLKGFDWKSKVAKSFKIYSGGGNFTGHISKMIPTWMEKMVSVATAISKGGYKNFLDIGTSEGGLVKTVAANSNTKTIGLDPNQQMQKDFDSTPEVENAEFRLEAFQASWTEDDGTVINEFKSEEKFDVVNEDFTFQFLNNNRSKQVAGVKSMMTKDGIFITSEKFHTANQTRNEETKLTYQSKYFSPDQLTEDKQTIISGMDSDMVNDVEYFEILKENFTYVEEFWNAGNFKGYIASDSKVELDKFKKNVGNLNSEFTDKESLTRKGKKGKLKTKSVVLNDPLARAFILGQKTIEESNLESALILANLDLDIIGTRFGAKATTEITKVLGNFDETGDPSYLRNKKKVKVADGSSVGGMDAYIAFDRVYKGAYSEMNRGQVIKGLGASKLITRLSLWAFGDTKEVIRGELIKLSILDQEKVLLSMGLINFLKASGDSSTDIELANEARNGINDFLKKHNNLDSTKSKTAQYMAKTTFLAQLLSPSTKNNKNLDQWFDSVLANTYTHIESLKNRSKQNWFKGMEQENEDSSLGTLEVQIFLTELKNEMYNSGQSMDENWSVVIDKIKSRFPLEFELLEMTSAMHKIHEDVILNAKKKLGDTDTHQGRFYNSTAVRKAIHGTKKSGDPISLDEKGMYEKIMDSTGSMEDRGKGRMGEGQYLVTWDFAGQQQRAYNNSSRIAYTGEFIRQMSFAVDTDLFRELVNDKAGVKNIQDKIKSMVNQNGARDEVRLMSGQRNTIKSVYSWIMGLKNQLLISAKQPFVQTSVGSATLILAPRSSKMVLSDFSQGDNNENMLTILVKGSSLGARNATYFIDNATSTSRIDAGLLIGSSPKIVTDVLLSYPDYAAATTTWLAFYVKRRFEQSGEKSFDKFRENFSWADEANDVNELAAAHADTAQQSFQASNVKEAGSRFSTSNIEAVQVYRETFVPFKYFDNSYRSNLLVDFQTARHDSEARKRVLAYLMVPTSYALVRQTAKAALYGSVLTMLGFLKFDDEEDETKEQKQNNKENRLFVSTMESSIKEAYDRTWSPEDYAETVANQITSDFVLHILPTEGMQDPVINYGINGLQYLIGSGKVDETNIETGGREFGNLPHRINYNDFEEFSMGEEPLFKIYDKEGQPFFKKHAYLVPFLDVAMRTVDAYNMAQRGYMLSKTGEKIPLTETERASAAKHAIFGTIAFLSPLQETRQVFVSSEKTMEKLYAGEWFNKVTEKGELGAETRRGDKVHIDLYNTWIGESIIKHPKNQPEKLDELLKKNKYYDTHTPAEVRFDKHKVDLLTMAQQFKEKTEKKDTEFVKKWVPLKDILSYEDELIIYNELRKYLDVIEAQDPKDKK